MNGCPRHGSAPALLGVAFALAIMAGPVPAVAAPPAPMPIGAAFATTAAAAPSVDAGPTPAIHAEYFVAPPGSGGSDANPGTSDAPFATIAHARDVVRSVNDDMAGDIVVWLRAGTYAQAETLTFGPEDSGTNGHDVVYRAHPGERVVVSGGRELAGWTPVPGAGFWAAPFGAGPGSRQLWVDGVRADRAAASVALLGAMIGQPGGYVVTNTAIQAWRNPAAIEFVYTGGGGVPGAPWTESRCGIASLVPAGPGRTRIVMDQPCFDSGQAKSPGPLANPTAIENAYELLARPGQWYLDTAAGKVYYWPRAGQDMTSARAVVPVLERLILAAGTAERPIEHVAFEGLEFAHATWRRPSSGDGFIELQANTFIVGPDLQNMPGNVEIHHARQLRFERCSFRHLGAEGLVFGPGSAGNVVRGCVFTDTSGVPLRMGDVNTPLAAPAEQVRDNRVENNLIHGAPVEYHGGPAIVVGYAAGTEIAHNEIANVPYSGISVGWGWGAVSYADGQRVHHNRVHDVMARLRDGGNVYVLGPQPDSATPRSSIDNNWLCLDIQPFGTIYLDQGSRGWHVHDNLVTQTATNWIYLQHLAPPAIDNLVERNLHDTAAAVIGDPSNTLTDNHLIGSESGAWPERAWTIANGSGLEPAFLDLAGDGVPRNVARGRAAIASSYDDPSRAPSAAADGDGRTCWSSAVGDTAPWIRIDLGAAYRLHEIQLATRQDANQADARHDFEIRASNDPDRVFGEVLLGGQGEQVLPWWDVFRLAVTDSTPYRYVFAVKTDGLPFSVGEFRALVGGAPPAGPAAGPKEPSPGRAYMTVSRAAGARDGGADADAGALDLLYTPGCGATDHVVFWGVTPFTGALSWSGSACSLGTSGTASIDPGIVAPGAAVYFVVVAQTAAAESSYGQDSAGSERPEAIGIGACDRPRDLTGVCP